MSRHLLHNTHHTATQVVDPVTGETTQIQPRSTALVHGRFAAHLRPGVKYRSDHSRPQEVAAQKAAQKADATAPDETSVSDTALGGEKPLRNHGPEANVEDNARGAPAGTTAQLETGTAPVGTGS